MERPENNVEAVFSRYQTYLRQQAYLYWRRIGGDFQEILGEVHYVFCDCYCRTYREGSISFSTHLIHRIKFHFQDTYTKNKRRNSICRFCYFKDLDPNFEHDPEFLDHYDEEEVFEAEMRDILDMATHPECLSLGVKPTPKRIKRAIQNHLIDKGYSTHQIENLFREIRHRLEDML